MIWTRTDGSTTTPPWRFTEDQPDSVYTPDDGIHPDMPGVVFITGGGTTANSDPSTVGADIPLSAICDLGITVGQCNAPWYLGSTIDPHDAMQAILDTIAYGQANLGWNDKIGVFGISNGWVCALQFARLYGVDALLGILTVTAATLAYVDDPLGIRAHEEDAFDITYPTPIPAGFDPYRDVADWVGLGLGPKTQAWYAGGDPLYPGQQMSFLARIRAEMHNIGAYGHLGTLDDFAAPVEHVDIPTMVAFLQRTLLAA